MSDASGTQPPPGTAGLEVRDLTVAYGGAIAVSGASLNAPVGKITGLIGPNGAGKTTTFNACNGLVKPSSGTISLFGVDVTGKSVAHRARLGLGRTFQRVEVCGAMTLHTNVALGAEVRTIGARGWRQVFSSRAERRAIDEATSEALELCGVQDLAQTRAATLSTGRRRLLELARVLAGNFPFLLLDEPSSGLDDEESQRFADVLELVVRERGVGILLVEHDMDLVMRVCDHIFVLDFGHMIFDGTPEATRASEDVRAAYLGHDAVTTDGAGR